MTGVQGKYEIQVVAIDFNSGESDARTVSFIALSPVKNGNPVVQRTQNPLVALFTAPTCATGSMQRVWFQAQSPNVPANTTNWLPCRPQATLSFEVAGMYPSTVYTLHAQVDTAGQVINGPAVNFTTGRLPSDIPFPNFQADIQPARAILIRCCCIRSSICYRPRHTPTSPRTSPATSFGTNTVRMPATPARLPARCRLAISPPRTAWAG